MRTYEQAEKIAIEHVAWCRHQGKGARDVLAEIGCPAADHIINPSWDHVTSEVAAVALVMGR